MVTPYANPQRSAGQRRTTAYIPDNGHAERPIGSIRRECLDHIVVFGEAHLRRVLAAYTAYYNEFRTHLSLDKDAPIQRPIQQFRSVVSWPVLGGLHHEYCRM